MLTIYGRTTSVNVQKVLWCLRELNVAYERIDAGLAFGKNREAWYLELNPNARIPLLVDGAFSLWESNSIVRYLAAKYGAPHLWSDSPEERALAERWMDWQLSTPSRGVTVAFQMLYRTPEEQRDRATLAAAVAEANAAFSILDAHLATRRFVAGDNFSIGDIPVGALAYRWLAMEHIERPAFTALVAWQARLAARPAFREHVMLPLA